MSASKTGTRVARLWRSFVRSLLFIPTWMTLGGIVLFVVTGAIDQRVWDATGGRQTLFGDVPFGYLVFGGTADAAQGVLSTVAGSWATILGVAYSVTLVTVQLSATKYSAQVIPAFERDRFNQFVLGAFAMTVVYAFLVLKTVRSETSQAAAFVPLLGVNLSIVLAIASLLLFIWFIANLAAYIRPARFVEDMTRKGMRALDEMREPVGLEGYEAISNEGEDDRGDADGDVVRVHHRASTTGYLLNVDWSRLRAGLQELAAEEGRAPRRIGVVRGLGAKVHEGDKLLYVEGEGLTEEDVQAFEGTFRFTGVRDANDDPLYVATSLGDMGITALSGGSTDAGVAKDCLESLMRLVSGDMERRLHVRRFHVEVDGRHVVLEREVTPAYEVALVEAKRIVDAAIGRGFWDVGEALLDALEPALVAAAASEDPTRWRDLERWVDPVLVGLLGLDDDASRRRMVEALQKARRSLAEEGHDAEAAALATTLRRAAREADLEAEVADAFADTRAAARAPSRRSAA